MTTPGTGVHVTGRRIVATVIDAAIVGAVFGGTATTTDSGGAQVRVYSASILVVGLYYWLMEAFLGRTIGKLITGIKVVDEATGGKPGMVSAFLRTVLRAVDGIGGYLLGFIVVVNSARRRRLGDMAARTLVVRA